MPGSTNVVSPEVKPPPHTYTQPKWLGIALIATSAALLIISISLISLGAVGAFMNPSGLPSNFAHVVKIIGPSGSLGLLIGGIAIGGASFVLLAKAVSNAGHNENEGETPEAAVHDSQPAEKRKLEQLDLEQQHNDYFQAAKEGKVEELKTSAIPIDTTDEFGRTALHYADGDTARYLLSQEVPGIIDMQDMRGRTALHFAVISGQADRLITLLCNGADRKLEDNDEKVAKDLVYEHPPELQNTLLGIFDRY